MAKLFVKTNRTSFLRLEWLELFSPRRGKNNARGNCAMCRGRRQKIRHASLGHSMHTGLSSIERARARAIIFESEKRVRACESRLIAAWGGNVLLYGLISALLSVCLWPFIYYYTYMTRASAEEAQQEKSDMDWCGCVHNNGKTWLVVIV